MQPRPESDPPVRPGDPTALETMTQVGPTSAGGNQPAPPALPVIPGFEILGEISRGGMGAVYKARQGGIERLVALKVILPDRMGSADAVRRFKREARSAALLNHPNIVTIYATDLDGPIPYLAMEYLDGIDLQRLVALGGRLSVADALRYILQGAQALEHAHEQGLVHRDIKPANLMLTPSPLAPAGPATLRQIGRAHV